MFPWPSSAFTVADDSMETGLRVNLSTESMPVNKQGVPVDTTEWNRNDGFSPSQMMLAMVPGVDMEQTGAPSITDLAQSLSPDSPVVVINASTGEQHLIFAELDANTDDPAEQAFIIRPMVQFERGARYIVALRNMRGADGELLEAPEVFRAFRDDTLTDNEAIEVRRDSMEALFSHSAMPELRGMNSTWPGISALPALKILPGVWCIFAMMPLPTWAVPHPTLLWKK